MDLTVGVFTLGCRVNQYESACLEDSFRALGFKVIPWNSRAHFDIGVINSCAVTAEAEMKTRRALKAFAKANPSAYIAVSGCYAQTSPEDIKRLPNVKWIVGNDDKLSLPQTIARTIGKIPKIDCQKIVKSVPRRVDGVSVASQFEPFATRLSDRANLKIQDGCDVACSYCIIPRARGLPRSRDFGDIMEEARALASRGVAEIVIAGINLSKYSRPDADILDVIDAVSDIPLIKRVRLGSIEPVNLPIEELAQRMNDSGHKLCKHLHLPMQSGSESVLRRMRRPYSAAEYFGLLRRAAELCPGIGLGSDVICGHHGEGDAEFAETFENIKASPLTHLHVFTFSERKRTLSEKNTEGFVPYAERKRRSDLLRIFAARRHSEFIKSMVGKVCEVLLENRLPSGEYLGFTSEYLKVAVPIETPGLKNFTAKVRISGEDKSGRARAEFLGLL